MIKTKRPLEFTLKKKFTLKMKFTLTLSMGKNYPLIYQKYLYISGKSTTWDREGLGFYSQLPLRFFSERLFTGFSKRIYSFITKNTKESVIYFVMYVELVPNLL